MYSEAELKKIPKFLDILNGQDLDAYVYSCYDGDTFSAIVPIPGVPKKSPINKVKINCRLYGIDTPEKRTKDKNEKRFAIIARDALCKKVLNKTIKITIEGTDKYGRTLAKVPDIEDYMKENNYGYSYTGGKKEKIEYHDDNTFTRGGVKYVVSPDTTTP